MFVSSFIPQSRLYEDEELALLSEAKLNGLCDVIDSCYEVNPDGSCIRYVLCNYFLVDDALGTILAFSGVAKLDFNGHSGVPIGTGDFVITGGSESLAGPTGKVLSEYGDETVSYFLYARVNLSLRSSRSSKTMNNSSHITSKHYPHFIRKDSTDISNRRD